MRSLNIRGVSLLSLCTVLCVAGRCETPIVFSSADIELTLHHIVVSSASPATDFLPQVPNLGKAENWKIRLKGIDIPVTSVLVDVDQRGVHIDFPPGYFSVFDAGDIPAGDLVVLYVPTTA